MVRLYVFDKGRLVSLFLIRWRLKKGWSFAVKEGRSEDEGCAGRRGGDVGKMKGREEQRIRKDGKMGQFYQTKTCPKSWPRHRGLGKKTES